MKRTYDCSYVRFGSAGGEKGVLVGRKRGSGAGGLKRSAGGCWGARNGLLVELVA